MERDNFKGHCPYDDEECNYVLTDDIDCWECPTKLDFMESHKAIVVGDYVIYRDKDTIEFTSTVDLEDISLPVKVARHLVCDIDEVDEISDIDMNIVEYKEDMYMFVADPECIHIMIEIFKRTGHRRLILPVDRLRQEDFKCLLFTDQNPSTN